MYGADRMFSIILVALLLICTSRVLAESRPENFRSQNILQRTRLSEKDAATLQSLGMSTSQIQSMFGTDVKDTSQNKFLDAGQSLQQNQQQNQEELEEEYEYESYDSDEDWGVSSIPDVGDASKNSGKAITRDDWKEKKEWWKDPLALFDEDPQIRQPPLSIQEDTILVPEPGSPSTITTIQTMENNTTPLQVIPELSENIPKEGSEEVEEEEDEVEVEDEEEDDEAAILNPSNTTSLGIDSILESTATTSSSSSSSIQPYSGLTTLSISGLPLLFQKALNMSPSFFHVAISFFLGKYIIYMAQQVKSLLQQRYQKDPDKSIPKDEDGSYQALDRDSEPNKDEDFDDLSVSEINQLQDLGFGRSIPKKRIRKANVADHRSLHRDSIDIKEKVSIGGSRKNWFRLGRNNESRGVDSNSNQGNSHTTSIGSSRITKDGSKSHKKGSLLFSGRKQLEKEIQRLEEEMEQLREASLEAESKRVKSEAENDLSRHEVSLYIMP